jgi:hypothetical protein
MSDATVDGRTMGAQTFNRYLDTLSAAQAVGGRALSPTETSLIEAAVALRMKGDALAAKQARGHDVLASDLTTTTKELRECLNVLDRHRERHLQTARVDNFYRGAAE